MGKCQYTAIGRRSKEIGRKLLPRKSRSRTHVTKIMHEISEHKDHPCHRKKSTNSTLSLYRMGYDEYV